MVTAANATGDRLRDVSADPQPDPGAFEYSERLHTPWWWYVVGVAVALVLAAEFQGSQQLALTLIPWILLPTLAAGVTFFIGRTKVTVTEQELRIRGAHVPLRYVSGAIALDQRSLRRLVGRDGDPQAFVAIRPWIGPGLQVLLNDADDPTPYWVLSSRHPEKLVQLLNRFVARRPG